MGISVKLDQLLTAIENTLGVGVKELAADPSGVPNRGFLYTKDVSGTTELFFIDSTGAVSQMTAAGALVQHAIGGGSHTASTLAQLNALVSDATLIDESALDAYGVVDAYQQGQLTVLNTDIITNDGYAKGQLTTLNTDIITNDGYAKSQLTILNTDIITNDGYAKSQLTVLNTDIITNDGYAKSQLTAINTDVATHIDNLVNPHATDLGNLGTGTLAELNTAVTDATLFDIALLDSYAALPFTVLDDYATAASLTSHTSDTANPHATDLGNLGTGTLAELNTAVTDATLFDISLLDSYAALPFTVLDDYALASSLTSHTSDTANPHATDLGNIGTGTLSELNTAVTDATLFDISLLDSYAQLPLTELDSYALASDLTSHTSDTANPHTVTMDQSYDAGRTITADSGPVELLASGAEGLDIDGYIGLVEKVSDPTLLSETGLLYTKQDDAYGTTELFYMDNAGTVTQVTQDGYLATANSLRRIGLFEQDADPAAVPGKAFIYAKNVSGVTELVYMDSAGSSTQMTAGGTLNADEIVAHSLGGAEHTSDTLASLNALITDATLFDISLLDSYAALPLTELDSYATTASLSSHTSDTANPHATDLGNLGTGTLAELNTAVTDATLFDVSLLDSYAALPFTLLDSYALDSDLTSHTSDTANPHVVTIDQVYDAGKTITADSGPVIIDASGTDALELDGYLTLDETVDPTALSNAGLLYTKDDTGDTELFFMDSNGLTTQITKDGTLNADEIVAHALGGSEHTSDTLASLNALITDATLFDISLLDSYAQLPLTELDSYALAADLTSHTGDTANPHATDLGNLGSGTLAELNAAVTDATLFDISLLDSYAQLPLTELDSYALASDLTSHTSDTANPHATDLGNLGTGTLAELNTAVTDATLFDISLLDSYAALPFTELDSYALASDLTSHTSDTANPHVVTMDQTYDGSGSGAGKTITADSGPVFINAAGTDALELDGYLTLNEISVPTELSNAGLLYTKDDGGNTELFYLDSSGVEAQMTNDGYLGVRPSFGELHIVDGSTETTLSASPTFTKVSGTYTPGLLDQFTHTSGTLTYTGLTSRVFKLSASVTGDSSASDVYHFRVAKNGTNIPKSQARRQISGANDIGSIAIEALIELSTNDTVEIQAAVETTGNITVTDMSLIITSI